jgi:hypothetical protein
MPQHGTPELRLARLPGWCIEAYPGRAAEGTTCAWTIACKSTRQCGVCCTRTGHSGDALGNNHTQTFVSGSSFHPLSGGQGWFVTCRPGTRGYNALRLPASGRSRGGPGLAVVRLQRGGVAPPERLVVHATEGRLFQPRCQYIGAGMPLGLEQPRRSWSQPACRHLYTGVSVSLPSPRSCRRDSLFAQAGQSRRRLDCPCSLLPHLRFLRPALARDGPPPRPSALPNGQRRDGEMAHSVLIPLPVGWG